MSIMLSAYSATPPNTVSNDAFALTSETGLACRTAPVEHEDVPIVTPAPKPKAFRAKSLLLDSVSRLFFGGVCEWRC